MNTHSMHVSITSTTVISQSSETNKSPTENPVKKVKFYKKEDPTKAFAIKSEEVSYRSFPPINMQV